MTKKYYQTDAGTVVAADETVAVDGTEISNAEYQAHLAQLTKEEVELMAGVV